MRQQVPRVLAEDVDRRREFDKNAGHARSELADRMAASRENFGSRGAEAGRVPDVPDTTPPMLPEKPGSVEVRLQKPDISPPAPAPKVKFSSSKAQTLVDGEYEYSIDPSSGVIKFVKAPAGKEHLVGKYLTSANQKNAVAYKAIMDKFKAEPAFEPEDVVEEPTPAVSVAPEVPGYKRSLLRGT